MGTSGMTKATQRLISSNSNVCPIWNIASCFALARHPFERMTMNQVAGIWNVLVQAHEGCKAGLVAVGLSPVLLSKALPYKNISK